MNDLLALTEKVPSGFVRQNVVLERSARHVYITFVLLLFYSDLLGIITDIAGHVSCRARTEEHLSAAKRSDLRMNSLRTMRRLLP